MYQYEMFFWNNGSRLWEQGEEKDRIVGLLFIGLTFVNTHGKKVLT